MDLNRILSQMSADIAGMSTGDKIIGCITVSLLCMAIVFVVLMMLMYCIQLMEKMFAGKKQEMSVGEAVSLQKTEAVAETGTDDAEIIAAITAAVYGCIGGAREPKIIIRKISPIHDSIWAKASLNDQINAKL